MRVWDIPVRGRGARKPRNIDSPRKPVRNIMLPSKVPALDPVAQRYAVGDLLFNVYMYVCLFAPGE